MPIWNQPIIINELGAIRYIHILPLLREHHITYFLFLTILCLIIYMELGLIMYMIYIFKKKKINIIWPISILKFILPIMCIGFFGQTFLFFLVLFDCVNDRSYISSYLECRNGSLFKYFSSFVIIAIILHLLISILTNILYYRTIFDRSRCDILKRTNSTPEILLLFTKMIIILIFILVKSEEKEKRNYWIPLLLIMLISGLNAYVNIHTYTRINRTITILNIILSLILFFGFLILFVAYIAQSLRYDGNIFLFFILVIIMTFFVIFFRNNDFDLVSKDYRTIINPDEYIEYILFYYRMIKHKDNSRNYSSMLKSYIETIEETCTIKDCPLEQYVKNLGKGDDSNYLLRRFLDKLFKYGNSKFKNNPKLKNAYSMLLLKMNHKKQAIAILNSIKYEKISFHTKYNIYRCKKLIDKYSAETNSYYFNYRTKVNDFKKLIAKTTSLYNEFWSLIYGTKFQHSDNFKKLFKIGSNIMELNQKIEEAYNLLIQTKTNNIDIYKLYNEYVQSILKDEEKNENFDKIKDMIFSKSVESEEKIYSNFDMDFLKHNGDNKYLLISGNKKDLGTIIDCSSSAAIVFGYTKEEILGKNVNLLIPEILHQKHDDVLSKKSNQNNLKLFDDLYTKREYNPNFIQDFFFGVSKSKFIKSLKLKIYFVKTEENILAFAVEILKDIPYMSKLIENRNIPNSNLDNRCCVLTNESFLIHSFTANCVEQLGLSYRYIKSNNSIIPCIKQFYEDYLNCINDDNYNFNSQCRNQDMISNDDSSRLWDKNVSQKNLSFREKQNIKKELINKKYNKKIQITWTINKIFEPNETNEKTKNENYSDFESKCSRISHRGSMYNFAQKKSSNEKNYERELLMEIKKIMIDNTLVGYYFFFSRIHTLNVKNLLSYSDTLRESNYEKNEDSNKVQKYKVLIKPLKKLKEKGSGAKRVSNTIIQKNASIFKSSTNKFNSNIGEQKDKIVNKKSFSNLGKGRNSVSFNEEKTKKSMDGESYDCSSDEVFIDEYFVPDSPINFALDLNNMIYTLEKDDYKSILLVSNLQKEAIVKIKQYNEYKKSMQSKSNILDLSQSNSYESGEEDDNSSEIEDPEYSEIEKNSSSINNFSRNSSLYKRHASIFKSITLKNKRNTHIESVSPIGKSFTLNIIKEVKENSKDDIKEKERKIKFSTNTIIQQETKRYKNVNTFNNYYKVDLSNIYFMIYDFNKDMIVEAKEEEKILEIERIKNESKKRNSIINIGKDQDYPHVSMKLKRKESQKKKQNKIEDINKQIDNINQNNGVKEEKTFERKIKEAINNKNEEESIKKLKIYTILLFIIILVLGFLTLFICFHFHENIQAILLIIKNIIKIKYCNTLSIYYIREITLLNFNITNIEGGIYYNFPAKDRDEYETLIRIYFSNLFFENQLCIMQILSSSFNPSKVTQKNLSETIFYSKYIIENNIGTIDVSALSTLIQYNAAFYSLASSSTKIEQDHPDLYNYIYNSFNNYRDVILLLKEKYNLELEIQKIYIKYIFYFISIVAFLITAIGSFFVVKSFISGAQRRINYMQVFYDINAVSIKLLIDNCEKLLSKLKKDENNTIDDYTEDSIEAKKSLIKNKKNADKKNIGLINEEEGKNKFIISRNNKIFIFFYILLISILYSVFPYFFYNIYKIIKLALNYSIFFTRLNSFHSNILDAFNVYREYLFDNQSIVHNMNPFDLLARSELMAYDTITDDVRMINDFLDKNIQMNDEVLNLLSRDICSYTITDIFQSIDDCKTTFGKVLNYDFIIFATNFIQKLRGLKNVVKYKHDTELIIGNLTEYNIDVWKTWTDEQKNLSDKKITFTLDLFNNETIHSNLNLMFINIFIPFIDENRKVVLNNILILGFENKLLLIFSIFLLLLFLIFLCYLFPKINSLSDFIYKTKNMLSLIPMTILTSQSNIKSLLKLS